MKLVGELAKAGTDVDRRARDRMARCTELAEHAIRVLGKGVRAAFVTGKKPGSREYVDLVLFWMVDPMASESMAVPDGVKGYLVEQALPVLREWPTPPPDEDREALMSVLGDLMEERGAHAGESRGVLMPALGRDGRFA